MEERRGNVRKDCRNAINHNSLAMSSHKQDDDGNTVGRNADPIPLDLTIDILSRLPVKSLVRFRCVSKLWSSIIRGRDFIKSVLTQSSTRPRLLVTFSYYSEAEVFVFSSAHPQAPGEVSSSVANHDLTIPGMAHYHMVSKSLRGLICFQYLDQVRICNPSTRELVTLPKTRPTVPVRIYSLRNFVGYDTINDRFKVLRTVVCEGDDNKKWISEHQVLVLGARNSWRRIEGSAPHYPVTDGLCIGGVMYYAAWTDLYKRVASCTMVCFDVSSEKFSLIGVPARARGVFTFINVDSALINYQGKLAVVDYSSLKTNGSIELWVLEDAKKQEWSNKSFIMPPPPRDLVGKMELRLQGTIHTGEIIIGPKVFCFPDPLFVFYYDLKKNSIRRVDIEGIADPEFRRQNGLSDGFRSILTFSDHVDSIMPLDDWSSLNN